MSLWLIASITPPFLWAIVNHIDKYLLSRTSHPSSVNVLMVYSTGFSAVVIPLMLLFGYDKLFADWKQIIIQIIGGILVTLSIYFYLLALDKEEASKVIPLALLVPVFGYSFSFFLLDEILTGRALLACALIILGALILSIEFSEESRTMRVKHGVLMLMIWFSAFQAAQETLFKFVTVNNSFFVSVFWLHIGIMLYGVILLLIHKNLWHDFKQSVSIDGVLMFGLNFFSEGLSWLAYLIRDYSLLLAPVAIVMTLNGYQPAFVFVLGTLLTLFLPKISTEKIKMRHLLHKSVAIGIMVVGTVLIAQSL